MSARLAIIDSGGANIASLLFAMERLDIPAVLTTDAAQLHAATHVMLPGVGAAADCMGRLRKAGLVDTIRELRQPLLGICVGMQLLFEASDEGDVACLGVLPGRVRRFVDRHELPVPHMGWNQLDFSKPSPLFDGIASGDYFYFVHSYCVEISDMTLASTDYGHPFSAVIQRGHVYGVQFHPERSAVSGARLLQNFLRL